VNESQPRDLAVRRRHERESITRMILGKGEAPGFGFRVVRAARPLKATLEPGAQPSCQLASTNRQLQQVESLNPDPRKLKGTPEECSKKLALSENII